LADFSFREDFGRRDDWCRFELHSPVKWTNPVFVLSEYFLGGNLVDSVVVSSQNGHMVELTDIDELTFYSNTSGLVEHVNGLVSETLLAAALDGGARPTGE
jgi:hypothetical protein